LQALNFEKCDDLQLSGLTHVDSPKGHIGITDCNGVLISNLNIAAPENSPNTDGIDMARSTNVHIQDSMIATGDFDLEKLMPLNYLLISDAFG
jgi:polygalacturonase